MSRHCVFGIIILSLVISNGCQRQRGQGWNLLAGFGSPRIPAPANNTYQIQGTATSNPPSNSYYNPTGSSLQAQPASNTGGVPTSPASFQQQSPGWQQQGNGTQNTQPSAPFDDRTSRQIDSVPPVTVASNSDTSRLILNDASNVQVPSSFQGTNDFQRVGALTTRPMGNTINVGNQGSFEITGNANVVGSQQNQYAADPYRTATTNPISNGVPQGTAFVAPANLTTQPTTHSNVLATATTNTSNQATNSGSGWQTTNTSNNFQR